eukprot:CAMPEP_0195288452 /NCGR_PEP_ID=MMETSP0707-20130614/5115_1 /TAXON_ID=33640 /ORGANISM="Asterionellopsis glacialis, Strain CCMP134" /LENGTH=299 /DNA_ID=CAMNT_0040348323 /DNA_START=229 /DNA_END=1128 /DNA_ORIENTATION=+
MSMSWDEDDKDSGGGGWLNETTLVSLWLAALGCFLLLPFCTSSARRKTCWRRIKEVRWHVEPVEEEEATWYRVARERYDASRLEREARERANGQQGLSREQKEEIRQIFLMDQLCNFTTTLHANDFKTKETDMAETRDSLEEDIETGKKPRSHKSHREKSDNDEMRIVEEFDHTKNMISVPPAGTPNGSAHGVLAKRDVPSGCAICLCEYEEGETVTWAANTECHHVFHGECIMKWLLAVGRKKRRRTEDEENTENLDPVKEETNFPMLCPCCRQNFVSPPEFKVDTEQENEGTGAENM